MPFTFPPLPYPPDALEPHIDRATMEIHHGGHHAAYVRNLNAAVRRHPELHSRTLEEILRSLDGLPDDIRAAVRHNGGGHANHSMFWRVIGPDAGGAPTAGLAAEIDRAFGSFQAFKEQFSRVAESVFGSGWVWVVERGRKLAIEATANEDNPLMTGAMPICGLDLWEHAYCLKYQHRRKAYIEAWWSVVNWPAVERRMVLEAVGTAR
jgi:Fe-Mn family superoxide dismutase